MSYNPNNVNGSATSANSAPVVLASDQAAIAPLTFTPGSVSVLNGDLIAATDVTGYKWLSLSIQGTFTATYSFQGSNDNFATTAFPLVLTQVTTGVPGQVTSSTTSAITWQGAIPFRYLRVRVTAYTSGTVTSTAQAYALSPPQSQFVNVNAITAGANVIGKVGIDQTTVGTTNAVSLAQLGTGTIATGNGTSSTGTLRVALASDQTTNTNPLLVKQQAQTTGGATPFQLISAATTNATSVKASAGTIYGIQLGNNSTTAIAYLKLYNKASAPTVGTDTPLKTLLIPFTAGGSGNNVPLSDLGVAFSTGIAFAITGGIAVADTTAVALSQVVVNLDYI